MCTLYKCIGVDTVTSLTKGQSSPFGLFQDQGISLRSIPFYFQVDFTTKMTFPSLSVTFVRSKKNLWSILMGPILTVAANFPSMVHKSEKLLDGSNLLFSCDYASLYVVATVILSVHHSVTLSVHPSVGTSIGLSFRQSVHPVLF